MLIHVCVNPIITQRNMVKDGYHAWLYAMNMSLCLTYLSSYHYENTWFGLLPYDMAICHVDVMSLRMTCALPIITQRNMV